MVVVRPASGDADMNYSYSRTPSRHAISFPSVRIKGNVRKEREVNGILVAKKHDEGDVLYFSNVSNNCLFFFKENRQKSYDK